MSKKKLRSSTDLSLAKGIAILGFISMLAPTTGAFAGPVSVELSKYLIIATGDKTEEETENFESFNSNNNELGANQEHISSGTGGSPTQNVSSYDQIGIDLTGTFVPTDGGTPFDSDNRWTDADPDYPDDTVGTSDFIPGGLPVGEAPDQSGNVAITGDDASFASENTDYHASVGIQCADSANDCYLSDDADNSYFGPPDPDNPVTLGTGIDEGITQFDPAALEAEIVEWTDFIFNVLDGDVVWSDADDGNATDGLTFQNINYKDGSGPMITDLDALDINNDGYAVIDIDITSGTSFLLNSTDWILTTVEDTIAIFRMSDGGYFDFSNSSVGMGPGCLNDLGEPTQETFCNDDFVTELGAIFATRAPSDTNQLFNFDNVSVNGIAFWDLDDDRDSKITFNNVQGCTHLISSRIELSSHNRLIRCALPTDDVPEPSTLGLLGGGFLALLMTNVMARRRRRQTI